MGGPGSKDLDGTTVVDDGTLARTDTSVPGPIGLDAHSGGGSHASPNIADLIVGYARRQRGSRIGDGECYTLANRALHNAGAHEASHYGTVTPDADYVWGTLGRAERAPAGRHHPVPRLPLRSRRRNEQPRRLRIDAHGFPGAPAPHRDCRERRQQRRGDGARTERPGRLRIAAVAPVLHEHDDDLRTHDDDDPGAGNVLVLSAAGAIRARACAPVNAQGLTPNSSRRIVRVQQRHNDRSRYFTPRGEPA